MILKMKMVSLIEKCIPKISQLNSQEIFLVSEKIISASSVFNLLIYLYIKNLILNNFTHSIKKKSQDVTILLNFIFLQTEFSNIFFWVQVNKKLLWIILFKKLRSSILLLIVRWTYFWMRLNKFWLQKKIFELPLVNFESSIF